MSNGYILDTCAWLDSFVNPGNLRADIRSLNNRLQIFFLADITLLEVARKAQVGDLALTPPIEQWFAIALPQHRSRVLPITPQIAIESTRLPEPFHKDPADRLIVATAKIHNLVLITSDQKILDYVHVESLGSR